MSTTTSDPHLGSTVLAGPLVAAAAGWLLAGRKPQAIAWPLLP